MEKVMRKNWIDWAKAIGILLVVMGHSNYNQPDINPMIFMIHMPLFFVVSGYLYKTNMSMKEISVSNVRTLLIPYILFNLIALVYLTCSCLIKQLMGNNADWYSTVIEPLCNTVLGIPGNMLCGPTWFLLALIWCKYIIIAFEKSSRVLKIFLFFVWIIAIILIQLYQPQIPFAFNSGIVGCIWFALGYLIKKQGDRIKIGGWLWSIAIPIAFIGCLYICRLQGNCNYLSGNIMGVLGLCGTTAGLICFFGMCNILDKVRLNLVTLISRASIAIMCMHMLIMPNLEKLTHYQHHLFMTIVGDFSIVLVITLIYPWLQKNCPLLIGYRR